MNLPKSNDPCWCGSGKKFKRCHKDLGPGATFAPSVKPGNVSPIRPVPMSIPRPDYVDNCGKPKRTNAPIIKTPETIEKIINQKFKLTFHNDKKELSVYEHDHPPYQFQ